MRYFVSLYDDEHNILVAQNRVITRWMNWRTLPTHMVVENANRYCFPTDEVEPHEENERLAQRVFVRKTGYAVESIYCHNVYALPPSNDKLVLLYVHSVPDAVTQINKSLTKNRWNHESPTNLVVKDWEIARVLSVNKTKVHEYLGLERIWKDTQSAYYYPKGRASQQSTNAYRLMVNSIQNKMGNVPW